MLRQFVNMEIGASLVSSYFLKSKAKGINPPVLYLAVAFAVDRIIYQDLARRGWKAR